MKREKASNSLLTPKRNLKDSQNYKLQKKKLSKLLKTLKTLQQATLDEK